MNEFLAHLRAGRRAAALLGAAVFATALLIAALLTPHFTATATLAVLPAPEFTVREDAGARGLHNTALAIDQIMMAETAILQSSDLAADTLAELGTGTVYPELAPASGTGPGLPRRVLRTVMRFVLAPWRVPPSDPLAARREQALRQFGGDLRVLPARESNVITVTFRNDAGPVAARVVNTLLAHYAERRRRLYDDPQLAVVRGETDALATAARDAETALAAFKASHTISDSAAERALLLRRQSDAAQALADAQTAGAEQQARLAMLDRQISTLPHVVSQFQENDTDARLQSIDASLVSLRGQLAAARVHYRDSSRRVTDLLAQVRSRDVERRAMADPATPSVTRNGRSQAIDPLLLDRAHASADAAAARARAAALRPELEDIAAALQRLNGEDVTLAELTRRKSVADANFTNANRVLAEQRLTEAVDALRMAKVRVIQSAMTPQHPSATRLLVGVAGALLGALAAAARLVLSFAMRPTFLTAEGLAHATGLPVLGVFPDTAQATERHAYAR